MLAFPVMLDIAPRALDEVLRQFNSLRLPKGCRIE